MHTELTSIRHSAAKLRNCRHFDEGDKVIVYDAHTKLSYRAVVQEILGTNNYLVESDNGSKHVSGDIMSRVSEIAQRAGEDTIHPDNDTIEDDNVSVYSDISEGMDDIYAPHVVGGNDNMLQRPRRGRREVANLGNQPQNLPRLSSGRF